MKNFLFLLSLFLTVNIVAQNADEPVLAVAEQMPSFPGGEQEMMKFIQENVQYPQYEKEHRIVGKCYVTFIVEKDGTIREAKILKGVPFGSGCDAEAIRVVNMMPQWIPGKQNGKEVRVQFNLPIKFSLHSTTLSEKDTIYYTSDWIVCDKTEAKYYRIAIKQAKGYLVKDLYIKNNHPQTTFECLELDPIVKDGKYILYFENGNKKTEGNFESDKRIGIWTFWEKDEKDSLVVECFLNGTYKNKYVPASQPMNKKYDVEYKAEVMPEFVGGAQKMYEFIGSNVVYPKAERKKGIMGTCYITFVVEKDGHLTDVKVLKGVNGGSGCDKEALRVVSSMPQWIPGSQFGRYVRVQFNLPIRFTLR